MRRFKNWHIKRKPPRIAACIADSKWRRACNVRSAHKYTARTVAGENASFPLPSTRTSDYAANSATKSTSGTLTTRSFTRKRASTWPPSISCKGSMRKLRRNTKRSRHRLTNTSRKSGRQRLSRVTWKRLSLMRRKGSSSSVRTFRKRSGKRPSGSRSKKSEERSKKLSKMTGNKSNRQRNNCKTKTCWTSSSKTRKNYTKRPKYVRKNWPKDRPKSGGKSSSWKGRKNS